MGKQNREEEEEQKEATPHEEEPEAAQVEVDNATKSKSNLDDSTHYTQMYELYSDGDEILSVDEDTDKPKLKERHFEFTSSINMMRVLRLIICIQILGLAIDSPSIQMPAVFRIVCRLLMFYSTKFFSRPIIDVVYFFQYLGEKLPASPGNIVFEEPEVPDTPDVGTPSGVRRLGDVMYSSAFEIYDSYDMHAETHMSRWLSASDYIVQPPKEAVFESEINFLNNRIWHSTKYYSHFYLAALSVAMYALFTIRFWEIKDYTDRREIREWLRWNVADGWWRRGLRTFTWCIMKGSIFLGTLILVLFAIARQFSVNAIPTPPMVGGVVAIFFSISFVYYVIGYLGMHASENVFVKYVSQNVSYTSQIILKRVVKSKVDIGIVAMFAVYMPALRVFAEGFLVVTDWNDNLSFDYRPSVNYYTPCYLWAFPPFTQPNLSPNKCSVHYSISAEQPQRAEGYYLDRQILSCDSYLGITVFTTAMGFFAFTLAGYAWLYWEFINGCVQELVRSRWVTTLHTLISIRKELYTEYEQNFSFPERLVLDTVEEGAHQLSYIFQMFTWLIQAIVSFIKGVVRFMMIPVYVVLSPFIFFVTRMFFLMCPCLSTTEPEKKSAAQIERERLAAEEEFLANMGDSLSYSESMSLLKELSIHDSVDEEEQMQNFKDRIKQCISSAFEKINLIGYLYRKAANRIQIAKTNFKRNPTVVNIKLSLASVKRKLMCQPDNNTHSLDKMGGEKGEWRLAQTIGAKLKKIRRIDMRIKDELRSVRSDFTSDHALAITVFDRVIDTSGLFMLISQYHYHRLYWTLVLWLEMTLYSLISTYANYYMEWKSRLILIMQVNIIFGVLTYVCKPFTEDTDRWLDFLGRLMVSGTLYGIVWVNENSPPGVYDNVKASLYEPGASWSYLSNLDPLGADMYVMVDCLMTFYIYAYVLNILKLVGFFSVIERMSRSALYGMHDHILDYLISNLEKRAIGRENIFEGLMLIQQWDDVVKEQRRYALIPWPDVRPADLVPASIKLIEIKWAAFFNLTLKNIRSSLGLSILHTSMCAADSEVARWLIHLYPELLNVEDFQRDTPIFVALKESSYFLLKYSEQQAGYLDDGTGYDDDNFLAVYPEIDQYRNDALEQGEYIKSLGDVLKLDAFELRSITREFTFKDTKDDEELRMYRPSFKTFKSKLSKYATQEEIDAEKAEKEAWDALNAEQSERELTPEEIKEEARKEAKIAAQEKASLYRKRFPEDDFQDNFESGQMASWGIIGLSVPDSNLFIDQRYKKFNDYDTDPTDPFFNPNQREEDENDYYDVEKALDRRYNVKSLRFPEIPDKYTRVVPNGHPSLHDMQDWDIIRKKKRVEARSFLSTMHELKQAVHAGYGWMTGRVTLAQRQEKDREVRFKMCKFAEILLSDEIQDKCQGIKWDINNYKELNKMSSKEQGRIAQNLAMSCNINPPKGFTRISEWTTGISTNVFDEFPYEKFHALVNAAVKISSGASIVQKHINRIVPKVRRGAKRPHELLLEHANKRAGEHPDQEDGFNDRIIHYLAECYCACRTRLDFEDCEFSVSGRRGWRAIVRALRRNNCTFIVPSVFVGTRQILTTHLNLSRNELDDGDAVLLSDVLLYKQTMTTLNLSHNRIGARGLIRMCKAMKGHENLKVLDLAHNRIGPAAGRELGVWMKQCTTIEYLDLSHNRLGELIQYPTPICRERVVSAARDFFQGMRKNRSLQTLDLSYNHLGPVLGDCVPISVMKHPKLAFLDLSGNDIGAEKGASLIFALGFKPGGDHEIAEREKYYRDLKAKQLEGIDVVAEEAAAAQEEAEKEAKREAEKAKKGGGTSHKPVQKKKKKKEVVEAVVSRLAYIGLRDNKLGRMAGHGLAAMVQNSKTLTSLDVSCNNIGLEGGEAFADGLEKCYGLLPRDFFKRSVYDLEQKKYEGRDALVRKVIYTNLTDLNMSQNGMGPLACQGLMYCMGTANCTVTNLDLSGNPLGVTSQMGGDATLAGKDMRRAISNSASITHLNLSRTSFLPVDMVPLLGSLSLNSNLKRLIINNTHLDEPSCLQLAHGITTCPTITVVDLNNAAMGPKGGLILVNRLNVLGKRLTYLDLGGNGIGPVASIPVGACLQDPECTLRTLYLQGNEVMDEGGRYIIKGMKENSSLTDVDLSSNKLSGDVAEILADVARGLYIDGKKICDCQLKRLVVSDNPAIGMHGAKLLIKAMTSSNFTHVELAHVGAGPGVGKIIADHIRDVALNWIFCDISGNKLSRSGLNEVFWGMRQNRSLRVFKCGDNEAGSIFGSDDDALLGHGIALQRAITANVILREIDLSYNSLSSNAMTNLFEGLVENYTIRKICLRGNFMDDDAAPALRDFLLYNNVVDDLDLGSNKLGYECAYSLAEGIGGNRSLKNLTLDDNNLNAAGTAPLAAFTAGLRLNTTLRMLIMDSNRLGSDWGYGIAGALARNNTLVQFSFRDNRLDERAGEALLKAFKHAPFLLEVALSKDEVGEAMWDSFRRVFMAKRSVIDTSYLHYETRINEDDTDIIKKYYSQKEQDIR